MNKYNDHIKAIKNNYPTSGYSALREALDCAVELMSDGAEAIGKTCKWQFSGNGWGDGHWYAECGLEWELGASGTLKEHGMNYCPRCGKILEEADTPYSPEDYADAKTQGLDLDDWNDFQQYCKMGPWEDAE